MPRMDLNYDDFCEILGYRFSRVILFKRALTHSSFSQSKQDNNERLEFLGDRVLGLSIAKMLYQKYPLDDEGALAIRHANLVSAKTLASIAESMCIPDIIELSPQEQKRKGYKNRNILADCVEAILGAMYLDGGLDCAKKFIFNNLDVEMLIQNLLKNNIDYKTTLQEIVQQDKNSQLKYQDYKLDNLENTFKSEVYINGSLICSGEGKSKKLAQIQAAKKAIQILTKN